MLCNAIALENFRNIARAEVAFDEGVNVLCGENAQGKTNLLEAIAYAALGRSFRAMRDEEMIRFGADMAEVSVDFTDSVRRAEHHGSARAWQAAQNRAEQGQGRAGLGRRGTAPHGAVLPEHLSLIKDGPAERRNFLDVALSQLYPHVSAVVATVQPDSQTAESADQELRGRPAAHSAIRSSSGRFSWRMKRRCWRGTGRST